MTHGSSNMITHRSLSFPASLSRFSLPSRTTARRALALLTAAGLLAMAAPPACVHRRSKAGEVELASGRGVIGRTQAGTLQKLQAQLKVAPDPIKLGETRQLDVTLIVLNPGKRAVPLKFATSQRIEVLIREPGTARVLSQWSADRTFDPKGSYLIVNPKERLEYKETITTRELKPGRNYDVEAYLIGYDRDLHVTKPITPQP